MEEQAKHETTVDSDHEQVGKLYAKALLGCAANSVDEIVAELESIVSECLDKSPGLERALASPRLSQEQKEGMLDRIFSGRVHKTLLNFLKILCRRGRINALRAIQHTATLMREEQLGKQRVLVTSSQPLSDEQRQLIAAQLQQSTGKESILIEKTDPQLLGGIILRIGDRVLDGSVLGKLDAIKRSVAAGVRQAVRDKYESLLSS